MGKLTVSMYVTLDGIMEEPSWTAAYWDDELAQFQLDQLYGNDALLLGRVTYDGFAATWPTAEDSRGFADRMNEMPKYVVSNTLKRTEWNTRLINHDAVAEIKRLKKTGQRLLVYGSAELIDTLIAHDLVDELHLMTFPLILGEGKKLFRDGVAPKAFKLLNSFATDQGVLIANYAPER
ncbi:dihydrofolate reductase family protein [Planococcus sp. ISL-109]|uniref:dihydrofolate reductase family protein n=1 Tax=Planococcus sp. ISL-109 TaxID=2819166 RepID=UPI001BE8F833|nr:dihydrofolate reductase family protein [Planococcus sp. ISL-109]